MATTHTIDPKTQEYLNARKAYWLSEDGDPEGDCTDELAETIALTEACDRELYRLISYVGGSPAGDDPAALRALLVALLGLGR